MPDDLAALNEQVRKTLAEQRRQTANDLIDNMTEVLDRKVERTTRIAGDEVASASVVRYGDHRPGALVLVRSIWGKFWAVGGRARAAIALLCALNTAIAWVGGEVVAVFAWAAFGALNLYESRRGVQNHREIEESRERLRLLEREAWQVLGVKVDSKPPQASMPGSGRVVP